MPKWRMFKKLDLATTEDKLKALIVVSGVFLFALLGTVGAIKLTMSPAFCSKCHVMAPEYTTWKASSHLQVACVDCHIKPGLGNLIVHKVAAVKELYLYFTGTYDRPIKMAHELEDVICTKCHSSNREYTPSGDLIIPHSKHAAKEVKCVECHSGVAHGNIVARNLTVEGSYEVWTGDYGKQQMGQEYTEPKMNTCLECHINRKITQACEACHTSISLPDDHKAKNWGTIHGLLAKTDLDYCNKCHSYSIEAKDIPSKDPVIRYARGNMFCYDCHQKRPQGHADEWRMIHKKDIKKGDVSGCLVCHNSEKPVPQDKAVPTYCAKCHGKQLVDNDDNNGNGGENPSKPKIVKFNKSHPANWRQLHPSIVKNKGASNEGCWNCHDTNHCSSCHLNRL